MPIWPGQEGDILKLRHQQAMAEEAQRAALQLARDRALIAEQRATGDINTVYRQKEIHSALKQVAMQGLPPATTDAEKAANDAKAQQIADNQYAQYIASVPQADTATNQATSALGKGKIARLGGQAMYEPLIGEAQGGALLAGSIADRSEAEKRQATAEQTMTSGPEAARVFDWEKIETSALGRDLAHYKQPFAKPLAEGAAGADISKFKAETAKNTYDSTEFPLLDAPLAAQAKNAEMNAARTTAELTSSTGGLLPTLLSPNASYSSLRNVISDPTIQKYLGSAMRNLIQRRTMTNAPGTTPGPINAGALVPRTGMDLRDILTR